MKTCLKCGNQFEQIERGRHRKYCLECAPIRRQPGYVPPSRRTTCSVCGGMAQRGTGSAEKIVCRSCRRKHSKAGSDYRHPCIECGSPAYGQRCRPCANKRQRFRPDADYRVRRNDREKAASGMTRRQREALMSRWLNRRAPCTYCPNPGVTMDHVVPLARGGTNYEGNLVPCCKRCNSSKAGWLIAEWRHGLKPTIIVDTVTWEITVTRRQPKPTIWAEPEPFKTCPACDALHLRRVRCCCDECEVEHNRTVVRNRYRQSHGIPLDKPTPRERRAAEVA